MLRMLAWSFEFDSAGVEKQIKHFCNVAIDLMPRVLLPMGEGLMLMTAGEKYPGKTAGAGYRPDAQCNVGPESGKSVATLSGKVCRTGGFGLNSHEANAA